jgi:hypothetical protein
VIQGIRRITISAILETQREEWDKSRVWLARAAFLLIIAFVLLVIGSAFRPLLPVALVVGCVAFYAIGRFGWHVQRSANARRRSQTRRHVHGVLKVMSDWPVPVGLGITAVVIAFALVVAALKR